MYSKQALTDALKLSFVASGIALVVVLILYGSYVFIVQDTQGGAAGLFYLGIPLIIAVFLTALLVRPAVMAVYRMTGMQKDLATVKDFSGTPGQRSSAARSVVLPVVIAGIVLFFVYIVVALGFATLFDGVVDPGTASLA